MTFAMGRAPHAGPQQPSKLLGNAFCFYLTTKCSLHSTQPQLPVVRDYRSRKHSFLQIKQIPDQVAFLERSWDLTSSAREGETGQDEGNGACERAMGGGYRRGQREEEETGWPAWEWKGCRRDLFLWCPYISYISYLTGQAFFMLIKVLVVLSILYDMILGIRVKK